LEYFKTNINFQEEIRKLDERERAALEKKYSLPTAPHIVVHPNRAAKSGKFDCTVMSLSLLLDYRPEDTKEHSFEVSLFAELFNEMLMRDFGFNVYKALSLLPDKVKEEKKDDDKKKDEKKTKGEDGKEKVGCNSTLVLSANKIAESVGREGRKQSRRENQGR
jgi:LAIKA domain